MLRRRPYHIALVLLALFLLGTVLVLSTVSFYLRISPDAYLTEQDIINDNANNLSAVVPRILHQTWKTDVLPERWQGVSQGCRDLMPD
jgi:inositol phosphorylceramide mannosyltransferase catalytic subunit